MKIPANQLSSHLRRSLAPCYLVSGDEPLIADEALDTLRRAARARGFSSRQVFFAAPGFDWQELVSAASNLSLFAERRILELRLPTGKPGRAGGQAIVDVVDRLVDDVLLLVSAPRLDRSAAQAAWAKALESRGAAVQVWPVGPRELPGWIAVRMKDQGLAPDQGAVMLIAERVEGNLLAARQEIEKLALLLGPGPVSAGDVARAVSDSSRYDVYKLADAALEGAAPRALRILSGLHAEGVEPVIVVWALTREIRTLATLADAVRSRGDIAAAMLKAGVWRNRQALVRGCLSRHPGAHFHRLLRAARRADATAKGQAAGDPWQLLAAIVVGLSGSRRRAA